MSSQRRWFFALLLAPGILAAITTVQVAAVPFSVLSVTVNCNHNNYNVNYNSSCNLNASAEIPTIHQLRLNEGRIHVRIDPNDPDPSAVDDDRTAQDRLNGIGGAREEDGIHFTNLDDFIIFLSSESELQDPDGLAHHFVAELSTGTYLADIRIADTGDFPIEFQADGAITIRSAWDSHHRGRPGNGGISHAEVALEPGKHGIYIDSPHADVTIQGLEILYTGIEKIDESAFDMIRFVNRGDSYGGRFRVTQCILHNDGDEGWGKNNAIYIEDPDVGDTDVIYSIDNNLIYGMLSNGVVVESSTSETPVSGMMNVYNNTAAQNAGCGFLLHRTNTRAINNYSGNNVCDFDFHVIGGQTLSLDFITNVSYDSSATSLTPGGGIVADGNDDGVTVSCAYNTVTWERSSCAELDDMGTKIQERAPSGGQWYGVDLLGLGRFENPRERWDIGPEEFVRSELQSPGDCALPKLAVNFDGDGFPDHDPSVIITFSPTPDGYIGFRPYYVYDADPSFVATLYELGSGMWTVKVEPTKKPSEVIESVWFPYGFESDAAGLGESAADDYYISPENGGVVTVQPDGCGAEWSPIGNPYPAAAPMFILTESPDPKGKITSVRAEVMAACDWPPKRPWARIGNDACGGDTPAAVALEYSEDNGDDLSGVKYFTAYYACFQAADLEAAALNSPWMLAVDGYKSWLHARMWEDGLMPHVEPERMRRSHGWANEVMSDFLETAGDAEDWFEDRWDAAKQYFNWLQLWSLNTQRGGATGPEAVPNPENGYCHDPWPCNAGNCCPEIIGVHPRFRRGDWDISAFLASFDYADYLFGHYSRPYRNERPEAMLSPGCNTAYRYLDSTTTLGASYPGGPEWQAAGDSGWTNLQWLTNWQSFNKCEFGATGFYHDEGQRDNAQNQLWLAWLYKTGFDHPLVIEYARDLLLTAGDLSGRMQQIGTDPGGCYSIPWMLGQEAGRDKCYDNTDNCGSPPTYLPFPAFAAHLLSDRPLICGTINNGHQTISGGDCFWNERQTFLLGFRFGWAISFLYNGAGDVVKEVKDAVVARETGTPVGGAPYPGDWWFEAPHYQGMRGVHIVDSEGYEVHVSRFIDQNGQNWLAFDLGEAYDVFGQGPKPPPEEVEVHVAVDGVTEVYVLDRDKLFHLEPVP